MDCAVVPASPQGSSSSAPHGSHSKSSGLGRRQGDCSLQAGHRTDASVAHRWSHAVVQQYGSCWHTTSLHEVSAQPAVVAGWQQGDCANDRLCGNVTETRQMPSRLRMRRLRMWRLSSWRIRMVCGSMSSDGSLSSAESKFGSQFLFSTTCCLSTICPQFNGKSALEQPEWAFNPISRRAGNSRAC